MNLFDMDNPVLVFLGRVVDLMILNMLTLVLCLPVVTAGAALTGMHYVTLKIYRDEDCWIIRSFFHSFKGNFRQATVIWGIFLAAGAAAAYCLMLVLSGEGPLRLAAVLCAGMCLAVLFMIGTTAFTLLARFDNTVRGTLYNAAVLTFTLLPRSIAVLSLHAPPVLAALYVPPLLPVAVLFFLSVPALGTAWLYDPAIRRLEDQARSA